MIKKLSKNLSELWAAGGIIPEEDAEVYDYGLQLVLSTALNVSIIILISIIMQAPLSWLLFLLAFVPLRITAGGYHASSHFFCTVTFTTSFFLFLLLQETVSFITTSTFFLICAFLSLGVIIAMSPVQASNKPLTKKESSRNRKKSIVLSFLFTIPALVFLAYPVVFRNLLASFYSGELLATISLIVVRIGGAYARRDINQV